MSQLNHGVVKAIQQICSEVEKLSHTDHMKRLLQLLQRLTGNKRKPPLHTAEELECFKRDAIENRGKHY